MNAVQRSVSFRRAGLPAAAFLIFSGFSLLPSGCSKTGTTPTPAPGGKGSVKVESAEPIKLKVAYIGLTCEPPIFVAYEKGFFKEEGLDVELVKADWDGLQSGLHTGRFDANHTLIMYMLKPLESGLDIKITGGIHTGCLRIQAGITTAINKLADLKGKRIGVATIGSPPFLYAGRVLAGHGFDPKKDVDWVPLPPDTAELNLDLGKIDAIASAEPIGTILTIKKKVRAIADQAEDDGYKDEYCCCSVVSGKLVRENPIAAAKVTRALLKGAKWVSANPTAAAKLAVEKKYLAASPEINAQAISKLNYLPGVAKCRRNVEEVAQDMKKAGFLKAATDPVELAKKAWLDLDGVTDEWVKTLEVEKVAGGGPPPPMDLATLEAILARTPLCNKMAHCCDSDSALFPLSDDWLLVRPLQLSSERSPQGDCNLVYANR